MRACITGCKGINYFKNKLVYLLVITWHITHGNTETEACLLVFFQMTAYCTMQKKFKCLHCLCKTFLHSHKGRFKKKKKIFWKICLSEHFPLEEESVFIGCHCFAVFSQVYTQNNEAGHPSVPAWPNSEDRGPNTRSLHYK